MLEAAHESANTSPGIGRTGRALVAFAALLWMGGIGLGIAQLYRFESTPGDIGSTPRTWPRDSKIMPVNGQWTLVMLVHPDCSCSRASLAELAQIMRRSQGRMAAWVLFASSAASSRSTSWAQAGSIPGVRLAADSTGAEAWRFGALTSGHVALYDAKGQLRFSGGITGARGHEGDNVGREQVIASIAGAANESAVHAVFGCALMKNSVEAKSPTDTVRHPTAPL